MTRFLGYALMTVGFLWFALTGLCTAFFAWITAEMGGGLAGGAMMVAIGAVPTAVGLVPLLVGRMLLRRSREDTPL